MAKQVWEVHFNSNGYDTNMYVKAETWQEAYDYVLDHKDELGLFGMSAEEEPVTREQIIEKWGDDDDSVKDFDDFLADENTIVEVYDEGS